MQALGDSLLEHETIGLPQIIEILGDRPYGMNETAQKYLEEMKKRQSEEATAEPQDQDEDNDKDKDEDKNEPPT